MREIKILKETHIYGVSIQLIDWGRSRGFSILIECDGLTRGNEFYLKDEALKNFDATVAECRARAYTANLLSALKGDDNENAHMS